MKKFFFEFALLFSPIFFIFFVYFIFDPFKVIHNYKSYYGQNTLPYIELNRDFISFETFVNNYEKYKYDSFIFGNSRSGAFKVGTWKKYINNGSCFHFDAYVESLYGICLKFKYLYSNNIKIKNALIVFDSYALLEEVTNSSDRCFVKHPELSGQSKLAFHFQNFNFFLYFDFITLFWRHTIMGQPTPKQMGTTLATYDLPSNELRWDYFESEIATKPDQFYTKKKIQTFLNLKRDTIQQYHAAVIKSAQLKMLYEIQKILFLNNTNYKIIISPKYDQFKLNKEDIEKLYEIFGKENVYDFSGINNITENYLNFYDVYSHYRPHVGDFIMQQLYKK